MCAGAIVNIKGATVMCAGATVMCKGGTVNCKGAIVMCEGGIVKCEGATVMCKGATITELKMAVRGKKSSKCFKKACLEPAEFLVKNGKDASKASVACIWVAFMRVNRVCNTILKRNF